LDYGCGARAKLLHQLQQAVPGAVLVGADPCLATSTSTTAKSAATAAAAETAAAAAAAAVDSGGARGVLLLTNNCHWAAAGADGLASAPYNIVVCSLVLCTVADRAEYVGILNDLAAAVKPGACQAFPAADSALICIFFTSRSLNPHDIPIFQLLWLAMAFTVRADIFSCCVSVLLA
jgi:hypothetical protein